MTREQLHALGLTDHAIAHRIKRGVLIRVHRGVYPVGHLPRPPLARAHAALLAVGDRSALSHGSAATFWGIYRRWDTPFEVSTPLDRNPSGIRVHHCVTLTRSQIHTDPESGIRVTSAARTALDLIPRMTARRQQRMVNDLRLRKQTTRSAIRGVIKRNPTHPGTARLTVILLGSQREPTRSELEDAFNAIVRAFDLPVPLVNCHVHGYQVDFFFPEFNLIVEVDGYDAQSDPEQFAADRRQDREILIATGVNTIRFTWDDCIDTPAAVADTVRRVIAGASARV